MNTNKYKLFLFVPQSIQFVFVFGFYIIWKTSIEVQIIKTEIRIFVIRIHLHPYSGY